MNENELPRLLEGAKNGDMQSFERLIVNYEKLVFNVAYRMLGNVEDAKDAAQDALVKIYKNIGRIDGVKGFKRWVFTITNNTCIDYLRKRKDYISFDAVIETEDGAMNRQIPSDEPTPEIALEKKERARQIQSAINRLSPEHRTLIVLRDINGLSYEEIADVTRTGLGTIKSRIFRARVNLKKILTDKMISDD